MKEVIQHFYRFNKPVVEKSLKNCHTVGLYSIVLDDKDGRLMRLFLADISHDLYLNQSLSASMSVGFHSHSRDLTLVRLQGKVYNVEAFAYPPNCGLSMTHKCNRFLYESKIKGNEGGFTKAGRVDLTVSLPKLFDTLHLKAKDLHTIYMEQYEKAAWLVLEGEEDKTYEAFTYSNRPLNNLKFDSSLYMPMSYEEVGHVLEYFKLL